MPDIVIIPLGEPTPLLPTSPAFAYGFGLFETMRYADGQVYFWRDHWARLSKSAKNFALRLPGEPDVLAALREYVLESDLEEAALKISLMKDAEGSQLYVYSRPPIPAPENRRLRLDITCPIFARSALAGHKTHNYMEAMHLLGLARAQGDYDTLRVDADGFLAETTTANLFFVKDGQIYTPSLESGILPGVTREALLRSKELAIQEGLYPPEQLLEADAVFITNATHGVEPIERIVGFPGSKSADFANDTPILGSIQAEYMRIRAARAEQLI